MTPMRNRLNMILRGPWRPSSSWEALAACALLAWVAWEFRIDPLFFLVGWLLARTPWPGRKS